MALAHSRMNNNIIMKILIEMCNFYDYECNKRSIKMPNLSSEEGTHNTFYYETVVIKTDST